MLEKTEVKDIMQTDYLIYFRAALVAKQLKVKIKKVKKKDPCWKRKLDGEVGNLNKGLEGIIALLKGKKMMKKKYCDKFQQKYK